MLEQAMFIYSLLRKAFKKQIKAIDDHGRKTIEALKVLKPEKQQNRKTIE